MSWTFVVLALVLFLFAIYIGFLCGQWACEKRVYRYDPRRIAEGKNPFQLDSKEPVIS